MDVSSILELHRLPELFCGLERRTGEGPTLYPVACSPQAWAAGAPFVLLSGLLGLYPDAGQGYLALSQPTLPTWLNTLEVRNIWVGGRRVHLHFMRVGGSIEVREGGENEVEIRVLPETPALYHGDREQCI